MSQSLWGRLEHRLPAVVDRTLHEYAEASPRYRGTVPEYLHRHMAHTCREAGRLFVRMVRDERDPSDEELRLFRDRARDRGAEGLPATDFVEAYFVLAETLWDECCKLADGNPPAEACTVLLRCLRRVMHAAVRAHQQEFQVAHGEEREAVGAALRTLVAGKPAAEFAHRAGVRLASSYAVLAVRLAAHSTEFVGDAVGQRLGGRRKVYRITEQLTAAFGADTLNELDPDGGLVLIPSTSVGSSRELLTAREAMPRIQQAADVEVTAGFAHATDRAAIPAAAAQATKLLRLATPGTIGKLDDHLFEYHVCHDSEASPYLQDITQRLQQEPELLSTVTTYFAEDFNRRRTARHLHVHPNTIDNRLTRIAAVTGANPRTARGLMVLGAALGVSTPRAG